MKNLIFLLFLFTSGHAFSQKKIDGFLGVKFGYTQQQIVTTLASRAVTVQKNAISSTKIVARNVQLGDSVASTLEMRLFKGRLYQGAFIFKTGKDQLISFYEQLQESLNAQYGKGVAKKEFRFPYEAGDGFEIDAIQKGLAKYVTIWNDKSTAPTKNNVSLSITPQLTIRLEYKAIGMGPADL